MKSTYSLFCIIVSASVLFVATFAQQWSSTDNQTLLDNLIPIFLPRNNASIALFPPSISGFEAPFPVRSTLTLYLARYEIGAACHPNALSFFGVKDPIPSRFCEPLPQEIIRSYINYRINAQQFPREAEPYGRFLAEQGLRPYNETTDTSTELGWANVIANRANAYLSNDGWNSLGELTRDNFLRPYFDQTGYTPVNLAGLPLGKLRRPLRW